MAITFTESELSWLRYAAKAYAERLTPELPEHVLTCLGKLNSPYGLSDPDDLRRHLPDRWYISTTGRKLRSRDADETPITPKQYDAAERAALTDTGRRALERTFAS